MFDLDRWQEIFFTIRMNKLRTFLTGFSVAWGIFMLIVLLGAGEGIRNGVIATFKDNAKNIVYVRQGKTTLPYSGTSPGRSIQLKNDDLVEISRRISEISHITPRLYLEENINVSYRDIRGSFSLRGVFPDHHYIENTKILSGRYLNKNDIDHYSKLVVIGRPVKETFFKNEEAVGKYLVVNKIPFKVIGVYKDDAEQDEEKIIYLPVTTAQRVFSKGNNINHVILTIANEDAEAGLAAEKEIKKIMAAKHNFDPADRNAVRVKSSIEEFQDVMSLINAINIFVWCVGIGTLLAGIVGVSNIMMITVKDRTKEIGIRKALGATPGKITGAIVQESIFITSIFGYIGLVLGIIVVEVMNWRFSSADSIFQNAFVEMGIAFSALILLIVSGMAAGLFPALNAATIRPVEALKEE